MNVTSKDLDAQATCFDKGEAFTCSQHINVVL